LLAGSTQIFPGIFQIVFSLDVLFHLLLCPQSLSLASGGAERRRDTHAQSLLLHVHYVIFLPE
jgi:hypothetical protein